MKALLIYNDMTEMVDISEQRDIYEKMIDTRGAAYQDAARMNNHRYYAYTMAMTPTYRYLIFRKKGTTEVDGEKVAIFEFYEER